METRHARHAEIVLRDFRKTKKKHERVCVSARPSCHCLDESCASGFFMSAMYCTFCIDDMCCMCCMGWQLESAPRPDHLSCLACRVISCVSPSCHAMFHTCVEIMIGSAQTNLWSLRCGQTSSLCLRFKSALRPDRLFWCTIMFHVVYGGAIASAQINLWSLCFGQANSLGLRFQGWVSLRSGQTTCFAYLHFFVIVRLAFA